MTGTAKTSKSYYARVLGTMWRHPRTVGLSLAARGLWVTLLSYSADHRTDGRIDAASLRIVAGGAEIRRQLAELSAAEMLLAVPGVGYQIRDWSQHNITRDKHEKNLENTRNRVAKVRGKGDQGNGESNALQEPEQKRDSNALPTAIRSEQDQDQDQDQDIDPLRGSGALEADRPVAGQSPERAPRREPPSVRDPWPTDEDPTPDEVSRARRLSVTCEAIRTDLAERYRLVAEADPDFTSPAWDLRLPPSEPVTQLARAFLGRKAAWTRTVAAFFGSPTAKAKGYPLAYLAKNPSQYLAEADRPSGSGPHGGSARGAPAATPGHGRPELDPNEACAYERQRERVRGTRTAAAHKAAELNALAGAIAKGWDPDADERSGWQP